MSFLNKLKGGHTPPPALPLATICKSALGAAIAIALVAWLTHTSGTPWILGSLGATCLTIFGYPDLPFSQPRHVVCGHALSAAIGVACWHAFGAAWWTVGLAVGLAVLTMMVLGVVHPPAASNPIIVYLSAMSVVSQGVSPAAPSWSFVLFPTLTGALTVVGVALIYTNLTRETAYPKYW